MSIAFLLDNLVINVLHTAQGIKPSCQLPNKLAQMSVMSLGPNHGIMVMNGLVTMNDKNGKIKYDVISENKKIRNGEEATRVALLGRFKKFGSIISCMSCCCCCCPCSTTFTSVKKAVPGSLKKL